MRYSHTKLLFSISFLICLIQIDKINAIPLLQRGSKDPSIDTSIGAEDSLEGSLEDNVEGQNRGVIPGAITLVGGALAPGQGFTSEVGKAIIKSMEVSAGDANGGGAASTVVNLPNTGYTVLKAADNDPGPIGSTTHTLFGGRPPSLGQSED